MQDWYWASKRVGPVGSSFLIENGKDALWRRVQAELDPKRQVLWSQLHEGSDEPTLSHILHLALSVVPTYGVSHNRFMMEAAKIPVFAAFLRHAPVGLAEYVSNPLQVGPALPAEGYSPQTTVKLGQAVSQTLGIKPDWFSY